MTGRKSVECRNGWVSFDYDAQTLTVTCQNGESMALRLEDGELDFVVRWASRLNIETEERKQLAKLKAKYEGQPTTTVDRSPGH